MNKAEAIIALIRDGRSDRDSKGRARDTGAAIATLGLNRAEAILVLSYLDYCDDTGRAYPPKANFMPKLPD